MRLIESYGDRGVLVHPRLERSDAERLVAPELASLTSSNSATVSAELAGPAPSPDDPGLSAFDGLGAPDDDGTSKKKSWLSF